MRATFRRVSKKKIALLALPTCAGLLLWKVLHPPVPVEFIGKHDGFRFGFKGEFQRSSAIDWSLPLLGRIRLPVPRQVIGDTTPDAYCGFLAWDRDPGDSLHLRSDGRLIAFRRFSVNEGVDEFGAPGSSSKQPLVSGLPFATDASFRDVELLVGQESIKLRLPVDTSQGPARRRATTVKAGPYIIKIEPQPWTLTTAPLVLAVSANAPPGTKLLITLQWKVEGIGNRDLELERGWLLEGSAKTYTEIPREFDGGRVSTGEVLELEEVPIKHPLNENGSPPIDEFEASLHEIRDAPAKNPKLVAIGMGGWWISSIKPIRRAKLPDDQVQVRYFLKRKWKCPFTVDGPRPLRTVTPESLKMLRMGMLVDRLETTQSVYDPISGESFDMWTRPF